MDEFIAIEVFGAQVHLAVHPVTSGDYKRFLHETGRPIPRGLKQIHSAVAPAIDVSQADAVAYCAWLGSQTGRTLRLPSMAELHDLMTDEDGDALDAGLWPHQERHLTELRGGLKPVHLCEWTRDTVEGPRYGDRPPRILADIFYPPWLRDGSNVGHVHASLSAEQGYAFVTFRLAYDG